jgi:hypothetical protein
MSDYAFPSPPILDLPIRGLTKREHVAAMAMHGILSKNGASTSATVYSYREREAVVDTAISLADLLLQGLKNEAGK